MTPEEELMIYEELCLKFDSQDLWKFFANCLSASLAETTDSGAVFGDEKFIDDVLKVVKKSWKERCHGNE